MFLHGDMIWTSQTNKTYVLYPESTRIRVFDVPFV
jgi:hypothetical protein